SLPKSINLQPQDPNLITGTAEGGRSGYAWVGLYFFFKMIIPKYRWLGLLCGIMVGLTFGISQQLRGAHFISHDIVTILICWLIATLLFIFFSIKKYTVKNEKQLKIQHL
ncbi:hypothetical protein ACWGXF_24280, partial [Comamonas sp. HJ-2]